MEIKNFIKKIKDSFFTKIIVYVLIILFSIGGMFFLSKKIKKEALEIKTIQEKTKQNSAFLSNLQRLQEEKKSVQECQKRLRLLLPKEIDSPTLTILRQLNIFARQAGVSLTVSFGKESKDYLPVEISLGGLTSNIIKFFELVKKGQFFLSIENVSWSQGEEEEKALVIAKGYVKFRPVKTSLIEGGTGTEESNPERTENPTIQGPRVIKR